MIWYLILLIGIVIGLFIGVLGMLLLVVLGMKEWEEKMYGPPGKG